MNYFAEAFSWCMLQVTLLSIAAACLYGVVVRFRLGGGAALLIASLSAVAILTLLCLSPWPRWFPMRRDVVAEGNAQIAHSAHVESRTALPHARSERLPIHPDARRDGEASRTSSDDFFSDHRAAESVVESSRSTRPQWSMIFVTVAGIAAVIGSLRLLVGTICLWRYVRSSQPIDDRPVHVLLDEFTRRFALRRSVAVRESASLRVAATAGWRRPLVLLPQAWREWTIDELRAVLAHELAHVEKRHFPVWALSQLPLVAHYYHPLVHWLVHRLRLEQELAADEWAARLFGGRSQYATVLAGLALGAPAPRAPFTTLGLFMSRPFLMRRIAMLRQTDKLNRFSRKLRVFVLLLMGVAAVLAAGMRTTRAQEAETAAEPDGAIDTTPSQGSQSATPSTADRSTAPAPVTALPTPSAPYTLVAPYLPGDSQRRPGAVALFQVSRMAPSLANKGYEPETDQGWQILCKTQLAKLKSYYVLQSALRQPGVASLPLIRSQADPAVWLAQQLEVGFMPGSEIMYIRLSGKRDELEQLTQLVDAVTRAYEDEVVFAETQSQLNSRDLLAANLKKLKEELKEKMETYYDLARETEMIDSGSGRVAQEIDMKRLDRVEAEIMRLENAWLQEQTSGSKETNMKFYELRLKQLNVQQSDIEQRVMKRSNTPVGLITRFREIEQLQQIANEMSAKLQMMDIEASAPPRIKKIQNAVPTGIGTTLIPMSEQENQAK